jgi:predicted nucleotide-binding protein
MKSLEELIVKVRYMEYNSAAHSTFDSICRTIEGSINEHHYQKSVEYLRKLQKITLQRENLSDFDGSKENRLLQRNIQRSLESLIREITTENKRIFIVHGRNTVMKDKVSGLLGRLKIDFVILENESNNGATIIEKFVRNARQCGFAVILFSADDVARLKDDENNYRKRVRQNVILELGYFLAHVGRENILILHEYGQDIEKPSDFDGIVYEPFDEHGAWKHKVIKELKKTGLFIEEKLVDRV